MCYLLSRMGLGGATFGEVAGETFDEIRERVNREVQTMNKKQHVFQDRRAMRNACDSDTRCGLACDASARHAESLAMRVEQCKPLSSSVLCREVVCFAGLRDTGSEASGAPRVFRLSRSVAAHCVGAPKGWF